MSQLTEAVVIEFSACRPSWRGSITTPGGRVSSGLPAGGASGSSPHQAWLPVSAPTVRGRQLRSLIGWMPFSSERKPWIV